MRPLARPVITIVTAAWCVLAAVRGAADTGDPVHLPQGGVVDVVDFERHVAGLLGRLGCNGAACHGSFQGKGGFRLSLFGQSPHLDHLALVGADASTRVDLVSPDDSLMLLKASGREEHGGGVRMKEDSWEYHLVRRWIAQGARYVPGSGAVETLTVEPAALTRLEPGQSVALQVWARFPGGDRQDVTFFCEFRSRDEVVAGCDAVGNLTALVAGDTAVVVSYRGTLASVPVVVSYPVAAPAPTVPLVANFIDDEVNAKLLQLGLAVSPRSDDAEFLRRATLDVLATVPAVDEVRSFLADADPHKRDRAIERLLANPRRAALWATRMCDITACNIEAIELPAELRPRRARMWHDWFRQRFARNVSYDQIVHGVLCATSRRGDAVETWIDDEAELLRAAAAGFDSDYADRPGLDLFWRRVGPQGAVPVEDLAELTATAFLGLQLHCARCHRHPYDRWTTEDFAGYANIFSQVQFGASTELRSAMNARLEKGRKAREEGRALPTVPRVQEVFVSDYPRPLVDSVTASPALPRAPAGPSLSGAADPREALFRWLVSAENPYFAKSFVNRLWAKYFGTGLVEPVDAFSAGNPATHPRLLERLADEFVACGYDIAHMERLILSSEAYQRSSRHAGNNAPDRRNVAHAPIRRLAAEAVLDALNSALETREDYGADVPAGSQAIEVAPSRLADRSMNELFHILGRGDRKSLCDCDRTATPTLRQSLFLMSDARVLEKIRQGRLARLLRESPANEPILDEMYLAIVSRPPTDEERDFALDHVARGNDRDAAFFDIVWGLLNSREFVTNH